MICSALLHSKVLCLRVMTVKRKLSVNKLSINLYQFIIAGLISSSLSEPVLGKD